MGCRIARWSRSTSTRSLLTRILHPSLSGSLGAVQKWRQHPIFGGQDPFSPTCQPPAQNGPILSGFKPRPPSVFPTPSPPPWLTSFLDGPLCVIFVDGVENVWKNSFSVPGWSEKSSCPSASPCWSTSPTTSKTSRPSSTRSSWRMKNWFRRFCRNWLPSS